VARQCGRSPVDAYTAALFHDIGRLGLLTAYPDQYEELLAASTGPDEQAAMERERFGVDHLQAGVWLARHWNLPDFIVTAMAGQQDSSEGSLSDAVLAKTGCGLADLLGFRGLGCRNGPNVDEILRALPEWVRPRLIAQLHGLQQAIGRELACSVESSYGAAPSETPAGIAKEAEHRVAIPRRTWRDDLPRLIPIGVLLGLAATLLGVSAILFRP
jgi:hypothetical protein